MDSYLLPVQTLDLFLLSIIIVVLFHSLVLSPMSVLKKLHGAVTRLSFGQEPKLPSSQDFYSLTDTLMGGKRVTMDYFKGDVLCIVNVASK